MNNIIDKLKIICEIAAKNASNSFSKLVDKEININLFNVEFNKMEKINRLVNLEEIGVGIYLPVKGSINAEILLIIPKKTALIMSDLLLKREVGTTRKLTEFSESALKEFGNIICGTYITVLSNILHFEMIAQMPNFSFDIFGAMIEQIVNNFLKKVEKILTIEIEFIITGFRLNSFLLFFFMTEDINVILSALEKANY